MLRLPVEDQGLPSLLMPRILVCDDEPLISMLLQDWLSELACETVGPATSVEDALALIATAPPDAAILDLSLGREKSYSVAADLRARGIPFAFATGYVEQGLDSGFRDELVVFKPFDYEAIKALIGKLLSVPRRADAGSPSGEVPAS
jgi:CheY-like chemotaxis protein